MQAEQIQSMELQARFTDGEPLRVIGLCEHYTAETMGRVGEQWQRFVRRLEELGEHAGEAHFGVHYPLSESPVEFEYMTAVVVDDAAPVPEGFEERHVPPHRQAVFTHRGNIPGLRRTFDAIFRKWLPGSGYEPVGDPLFIEVYGEEFDPVRLEGEIDIRVPINET